MKILVDTLGSDLGALEIVKGALSASKELEYTPVFLGESEFLSSELKNEKNYEIVSANEVIENNEEPAFAVRRKKNSSIAVGATLLKKNEADGMFSCGSTGALLAAGLFIVGRISGIERAAISVFLPAANGHVLLTDCGANMDTKPDMLVQFAIMGESYARLVMGKPEPKVALLNVGAEEGKGNLSVKEAYELLKSRDLNFIGNIEGRDLFSGAADVVVADGFSGNIALKTIEGTATSLMKELKEGILSSYKSKLGALLMKDVLSKVKNRLDYRSVGGAPLLGLNKPLFKGHGSSDERAVHNGILQLGKFIERDVIKNIEEKLSANLGGNNDA